MELSFEQKSWVNTRFQTYYDEGMRLGAHGHYETMFGAMHRAYADFFTQAPIAAADTEAAWEEMKRGPNSHFITGDRK